MIPCNSDKVLGSTILYMVYMSNGFLGIKHLPHSAQSHFRSRLSRAIDKPGARILEGYLYDSNNFETSWRDSSVIGANELISSCTRS